MKTLGISISRRHLAAFFRERSLFAEKSSWSCSVECREPFGGADDVGRLAEEVRRRAGRNGLPSAILSIPPSWTFIRRVALPVHDLARARKIHLSELEGNLPVEDEEILSNLIPPPKGREPGPFIAIAARRPDVERSVSLLAEGGFRVDRVVTDHVAILCAALAWDASFDGLVLSFPDDIVALRIAGGAVLWARQFPAFEPGAAPDLEREVRALAKGTDAEGGPFPVAVLGLVPPSLSDGLETARFIPAPDGAGTADQIARGAALSPSFERETGGFSLRTSLEAEAERKRMTMRVRLAAAAGAVALLSAAGAFETARWAEGNKVAKVRAQIRKEFNEAVPGVKTVVQETAQMRDRIQGLARQQKELGIDRPAPASLLANVSAAMPARENLVIREVTIDAGRVRLAGEAESSRLVETFRSALETGFGAGTGVTVQESRAGARGGGVKFTILIEQKGPSRAG